jgi:hypothetical protein
MSPRRPVARAPIPHRIFHMHPSWPQTRRLDVLPESRNHVKTLLRDMTYRLRSTISSYLDKMNDWVAVVGLHIPFNHTETRFDQLLAGPI